MIEGVGGPELVAREDLVAMATNEPCREGVMHGVLDLKMPKWAISVFMIR